MKKALLSRALRAFRNRLPMRLARFIWVGTFIAGKGTIAYVCPICYYGGPFIRVNVVGSIRDDAECPNCGGRERHRLLLLVVNSIAAKKPVGELSLLHVAPERQLSERFRQMFGRYTTADLKMKEVDHSIDLRSMPFDDNSFDWIIASHVLEHIKEDIDVLKEIRRVMRPGGVALLPVPVSGANTVEFTDVNYRAYGHVRSPGLDYFERFRPVFKAVELLSSDDFPPEYQTALNEKKDGFDREFIRRPEYIPVAYS